MLPLSFLKAEVIKSDLDKVIDYRSGTTRNEDTVEPPKALPDIKYVWTLPDRRGQRTSNDVFDHSQDKTRKHHRETLPAARALHHAAGEEPAATAELSTTAVERTRYGRPSPEDTRRISHKRDVSHLLGQ